MSSVPTIEPRESGAEEEGDSINAGGVSELSPESAGPLFTEDPQAGRFLLPGGYVSKDGLVFRQVTMRPVTGLDEEWLSELPAGTFAASVITGLLIRCMVRLGSICPVPRSVVSGLLVSDREYLVMKLREMTFGPLVDSIVRCADETCGKPMHISFSLADYSNEQKPVTARFFNKRVPSGVFPGQDCEIEFRLPTGDDQEVLAPVFAREGDVATAQLVARCVRRIDGKTEIGEADIAGLPEDARRELAAEFERLAPPLVCEFESACPECGSVSSSTLDFSTFFLDEMKSSLLHLEREIHLLAWNYHWSERDVLSLTRNKRRRYVEMVTEEIDRAIGVA